MAVSFPNVPEVIANIDIEQGELVTFQKADDLRKRVTKMYQNAQDIVASRRQQLMELQRECKELAEHYGIPTTVPSKSSTASKPKRSKSCGDYHKEETTDSEKHNESAREKRQSERKTKSPQVISSKVLSPKSKQR